MAYHQYRQHRVPPLIARSKVGAESDDNATNTSSDLIVSDIDRGASPRGNNNGGPQ